MEHVDSNTWCTTALAWQHAEFTVATLVHQGPLPTTCLMTTLLMTAACYGRPPKKIAFGWHSYVSYQLDTDQLRRQDLQCTGTSSLELSRQRTSDSRTCHTAILDSRWRRLYLGTGITVEREPVLWKCSYLLTLFYDQCICEAKCFNSCSFCRSKTGRASTSQPPFQFRGFHRWTVRWILLVG